MNCTYTAQGNIICKNKNTVDTTKYTKNQRIIERFGIVNETPNESDKVITSATSYASGVDTASKNYCQNINKDFMAVSTKHSCSVSANLDTCAFNFVCNKK